LRKRKRKVTLSQKRRGSLPPKGSLKKKVYPKEKKKAKSPLNESLAQKEKRGTSISYKRKKKKSREGGGFSSGFTENRGD